jgi:uncharacterized protein YrzB (UPF0473 family)
MRSKRSLAVGIIGLLATAGLPTGSHAQTTPPGAKILGQPCNLLHDLVPTSDLNPKPATPIKLTPLLAPEFVPGENSLDPNIKDKILKSGLPCQETVSGGGPDGSKNTALENRQRGFDYYSWLTFIALNSPAEGGSIGQSGPDARTKWESRDNFMHLLDVMIKDPVPGKKEPKWNEREIPKECVSKYKDTVKNINEMMVIEMIEETFNEPFKTGALIDQQGNYALFDILMNKQMFEYIRENKLYSRTEQVANAGLKVDFPSGFNPDEGKTEGGDPGAIMVKVSWKVIESESEKRKFHTVDALVLMPRHDEKSEPPCLRKTLGLVGFHVAHKTVARRQWIWTSFEHVDNVPEEEEIKSGQLKPSYNFYKKCDDACPVNNQTPPHPWAPTYDNELKFHDRSFRSQITRVIPLTDETKDMNKRFQAILENTVWKNYMLLSTQWPSDFDCSTRGDPNKEPSKRAKDPTDFTKQPDMNCAATPTFLANSTLETYSQGTVPLASSNCMGCHGNAVSYQRRSASAKPNEPDKNFFNQSDFTFMLEKAR